MPISDRHRALSEARRLSQQDMYSNGHIVHTEWAGHHDSTIDPLHHEPSSYYNDDHAEYQHSGVHHPYHTDNGMNYRLKGGHDSHHSDLGDYTMHSGAYDSRYGSVVSLPRGEHHDSDMDMQLNNPIMDKQRNNSVSSNASSNSSNSTANKHPCQFPTCGWSFKRYEHLKRHMLVHTKERPFVCEFQGCEKSFSRSDNFSAHLRTHTKKSMHMRKFDRHLMMDPNNNFMPLNNPNVGSGGMVANGMVCVVGRNDDGRGYSAEPSHYHQSMNGYPDYHDSRHSPPLSQLPQAQAIEAGHGSLDSVHVKHGTNPISKFNRPTSRDPYSLSANSGQGADYESLEDSSSTSPSYRFSLSKHHHHHHRRSPSLGTPHPLDGPSSHSAEYNIDTKPKATASLITKREESSSFLSILSTKNSSTFSINSTTSAASLSSKASTTVSSHYLSKPAVFLPKFSLIKIDLKAVSNNPNDVHLHNQHNIKSESLNRHSRCSSHHYQEDDDYQYRHRIHDDRDHEFGHHSSNQGPPYACYNSPGLRSPTPPSLRSSSSAHRSYGSLDMSQQQQQHPHHRVMLGSSHDNPNPNPNGESPTLPPRRLSSPSFKGSSTGFSSHFVPMEAGHESGSSFSRRNQDGFLDRDEEDEDEHVDENEVGDDDEEEDDEDTDGDDEEVAENALRTKKLQMMETYQSSFNLTSHHSHMNQSISPPLMMPIRSSSEGYAGSAAMMLDEDGNASQRYGDGSYHRHSIAGYSPDPFSSSTSGHRMPAMSPLLQSSSTQGSSGYSQGPRGSSYHSEASLSYSQGYLRYGVATSSSYISMAMGEQQPQHYPQQRHHRMMGAGNASSGGSGSQHATGRVRGSGGPSKNHCCPVPGCMKRFKRLEHLKRHTKTHTLERPFVCTSSGCNKRFSRSDNLSQHIKTHQRQLMSMTHWKHRSTMPMPGL
ncbi:homeodomain transcription factor ste12 [Haplosporangium gracile]|nr:homeodomain transcription factor ste12 [Haplosporangium gracile]